MLCNIQRHHHLSGPRQGPTSIPGQEDPGPGRVPFRYHQGADRQKGVHDQRAGEIQEMGRQPFYCGIGAIHPLTTQTMIKQAHRNSHIYEVKTKMELLCISDVHWDNPKCDRETLVRHLDRFPDAKIAINGDLFCYMQGRFDPRGSKKDILPEHNKANYLDAVSVSIQ